MLTFPRNYLVPHVFVSKWHLLLLDVGVSIKYRPIVDEAVAMAEPLACSSYRPVSRGGGEGGTREKRQLSSPFARLHNLDKTRAWMVTRSVMSPKGSQVTYMNVR